MSRPNLIESGARQQKSLMLKEAAFHDAAIQATANTGDDLNDDPNALNDNDKMIAIARHFLETMAPSLLQVLESDGDGYNKSSKDRLVKIGRSVSSTMRHARRRRKSSSSPSLLLNLSNKVKEEGEEETDGTYSKDKIDASLGLLADECSDLAELLKGGEHVPKVPKVRFGKTELQMPVVTLGCMRFQQSWNRTAGQHVLDMSKVQDDCQENLVEILRYAYQTGVTHIETAKGYGSSQLQLGYALKSLFDSGEMKREELIIQTKGGISSSMTVQDYKKQIEESISLLQLDYVDLFSMHGLNTQDEYDLLFNNPKKNGENLIEALKQLKREGKILHFGFSTHGPANLIQKAIETNAFDYVNLHYHFCGSYTASGDLECGGNLSNIRLAKKLDMGVFIISPYDKGGRLYAPSNKLRDLCLPEFEPLTFASVWLWQHALHDAENAPCHTLVVGAARPSDLDQPVLASHLLLRDQEELAERRQCVTNRLSKAMNDALGQSWIDNWHVGLPNAYTSKYQTHLTGIVWTYNLIKAWGLLDFAKDRYGPMENHLKKWDINKSKEENLKSMGAGFGWMPGTAIDFENLDYTDDLANYPVENKERLLEALQFVHKWASSKKNKEEGKEKDKVQEQEEGIPLEWEVAYDMRPWTAFPER